MRDWRRWSRSGNRRPRTVPSSTGLPIARGFRFVRSYGSELGRLHVRMRRWRWVRTIRAPLFNASAVSRSKYGTAPASSRTWSITTSSESGGVGGGEAGGPAGGERGGGRPGELEFWERAPRLVGVPRATGLTLTSSHDDPPRPAPPAPAPPSAPARTATLTGRFPS